MKSSVPLKGLNKRILKKSITGLFILFQIFILINKTCEESLVEIREATTGSILDKELSSHDNRASHRGFQKRSLLHMRMKIKPMEMFHLYHMRDQANGNV